MQKLSKLSFLMFFLPITAFAGTSLPSGGGGAFDFATKWLQQFVDFVTGPWATAVVIVSVIAAIGLYSVAPKEGILAVIMRIAIGGIVLLNIGIVITGFKG